MGSSQPQSEFLAAEFRSYLQDNLLARCRVNPRCSLRSYARSLGVEPSALSKILRGKRLVTPAMFEKLAPRLNLGEAERRHYFRVAAEPGTFNELTLEAFQVISDWYHFAILDLMRLGQFKSQPKWIANALGISVSEVNTALERLQKLGLVTTDTHGKLMPSPEGQTTVSSPFTAAAFQGYQKQVLEKAVQALYEIPMERRDQSTITMAVNSKRLGEAKRRIKDFRRRLSAYLEEGTVKDEVYHLVISLYPVTNFFEGERKR